jgi:hypothetical protein
MQQRGELDHPAELVIPGRTMSSYPNYRLRGQLGHERKPENNHVQ